MCISIGSALSAEPAKTGAVEFIIGDYLPTEGGDWQASDSPLREPFGIDFDTSDAMYIVELSSGRLHKRSSSGKLQTLCDRHEQGYAGDGGVVSQAKFNGPHNCVVAPGDRLLVADSWNHCVREIDLKTLRVNTIAGTGEAGFDGDGGPAARAEFDYVMCIALSPDNKTLHIADLKNRRIRDVKLETGIVGTVAGNGDKGIPEDGAIATAAPLVDPRAVASDTAGTLYILERSGHALRVVDRNGRIKTVAGTGERGFRDGQGGEAQFGSPKHICCDPAGNVYIADDINKAIRKYDPRTGEVSTVLGRGFGDPRIVLEHPHGVRWHADSLYVVDTGHNRILRVNDSDTPE